MLKSGYCLIDCMGLNLLGGETPQTIGGLYDSAYDAFMSGKMCFACNCEYGEGVPMSPVPVMMIIENNTIIATSSILQVRISEDDSVIITSLLTTNRNKK